MVFFPIKEVKRWTILLLLCDQGWKLITAANTVETERGKRCLNARLGADAILPNTHKSPEHPRDSGYREGAHFKRILDTACLSGLHCYCFTFRSLNKIASLPLQVWAETDPPVSLSSNELLREPENSKFA